MKNHITIFLFIKFQTKFHFDSKHLCIKFNKIDALIRIYNETRYLVLFGSEKYDSI